MHLKGLRFLFTNSFYLVVVVFFLLLLFSWAKPQIYTRIEYVVRAIFIHSKKERKKEREEKRTRRVEGGTTSR